MSESDFVSDRRHHFGDLRDPLHLGSRRAPAEEGRHELKTVVLKIGAPNLSIY